MVTNGCTDHLRRAKRVFTSLDDMAVKDMMTRQNREQDLIEREEFLRIGRLLDSIPPEQASVLRFRVIDGLRFTDIAAILEIPVTTVKSRFTYGIEKLRTRHVTEMEVSHGL